MLKETIYSEFDLESGICSCCGEHSNEILTGTGKCIDCIEEIEFYEETMKGL